MDPATSSVSYKMTLQFITHGGAACLTQGLTGELSDDDPRLPATAALIFANAARHAQLHDELLGSGAGEQLLVVAASDLGLRGPLARPADAPQYAPATVVLAAEAVAALCTYPVDDPDDPDDDESDILRNARTKAIGLGHAAAVGALLARVASPVPEAERAAYGGGTSDLPAHVLRRLAVLTLSRLSAYDCGPNPRRLIVRALAPATEPQGGDAAAGPADGARAAAAAALVRALFVDELRGDAPGSLHLLQRLLAYSEASGGGMAAAVHGMPDAAARDKAAAACAELDVPLVFDALPEAPEGGEDGAALFLFEGTWITHNGRSPEQNARVLAAEGRGFTVVRNAEASLEHTLRAARAAAAALGDGDGDGVLTSDEIFPDLAVLLRPLCHETHVAPRRRFALGEGGASGAAAAALAVRLRGSRGADEDEGGADAAAAGGAAGDDRAFGPVEPPTTGTELSDCRPGSAEASVDTASVEGGGLDDAASLTAADDVVGLLPPKPSALALRALVVRLWLADPLRRAVEHDGAAWLHGAPAPAALARVLTNALEAHTAVHLEERFAGLPADVLRPYCAFLLDATLPWRSRCLAAVVAERVAHDAAATPTGAALVRGALVTLRWLLRAYADGAAPVGEKGAAELLPHALSACASTLEIVCAGPGAAGDAAQLAGPKGLNLAGPVGKLKRRAAEARALRTGYDANGREFDKGVEFRTRGLRRWSAADEAACGDVLRAAALVGVARD